MSAVAESRVRMGSALVAVLAALTLLIQPWASLGIMLVAATSIVMLLVAPYAVVGLHFGGVSETLRYSLGETLPHGLVALVTASVLLCVARKGRINRGVTSLLVLSQVGFAVLMFASSQWAPDPEQCFSKLQGFIVSNMLALVAPLLMITTMREAGRVMIAFGVGAATLTTLVWHATLTGSLAEVQQLQGLNICPINTGRTAGLGALIAVYWLWQARHRNRRALPILAGVLVFFLYGLVASQTRGAVLAFVISLLVLVGCNWICLRHSGITWVTIGLASVLTIVAFTTLPSEFVGRYSDPLSTAPMRIVLLKASSKIFLDAPLFGAGAGAAEYVLGIWPHNLFLETGAELGLAGLILLSVLLVGTFRAGLRTLMPVRADYEPGVLMATLLACFSFALIEAQVSASIVGNAVIWFFAGIILAVSAIKKKTLKQG